MGLYIPNAKIPVSCNKCYEIGLAHRLRDLGGHCPRMDLHYSPDEQAFKGDRRVDCHLLDVPPHGRLIDADALDIYQRAEAAYAEYQEDEDNFYLEGMADGLREAAKQLSVARTIIPSREEG